VKETSDLDYILWRLIQRTVRTITRVREKELEKWELTTRKAAVLRNVIELGDEATITKLAERMVLAVSSLSEQVKRMERNGLLKKVSDLNKKNVTRIEITDKGNEMYLKVIAQGSKEDLLSILTTEEKSELWSILSKVREEANKRLGIKSEDRDLP